MALFKVLSLLILIVIAVSNNDFNRKISCKDKCTGLVIFDSINRFEYDKVAFEINATQAGYILSIPDGKEVKKKSGLKSPIMEVYINDQKYIAKGNPLVSSSVPKGADLFFAIYDNTKIVFTKGNEIVLLKCKNEP